MNRTADFGTKIWECKQTMKVKEICAMKEIRSVLYFTENIQQIEAKSFEAELLLPADSKRTVISKIFSNWNLFDIQPIEVVFSCKQIFYTFPQRIAVTPYAYKL